MESLFDLPAHPLLVHLPVVAIPVVGLATIAIALRPSWRRRYGWFLVALAGVTLVATLFAMNSGEALNEVLEDRIGPLADDHESYAQTTRVWVILLFVGLAGFVGVGAWLDRTRTGTADGEAESTAAGEDRRDGVARAAMAVLAVASVGAATLSTYWVVRTGHEGARITWDGVIPEDEAS